MEAKPYYILLYYHYARIQNVEAFREAHHRYCVARNLRGRIIIAEEGINGTVSGLKEDCEQYMQMLRQDKRFRNIIFKVEEHSQHAFQKLHVRIKPEIVHAGLSHIDPTQKAGQYLTPAEFKEIKGREDVVIVDVRSTYEHQLGTFRGAVTLDINHFREFPDQIENLRAYQDKKIVTICTGGIKCEKASAYLLEKGFKDVYQLHGGIIQYGLDTDGEDFEGKCYVFDNRLAVDINRKNPTVISECYICHTRSSRMVNCANPICNKHVPICEPCGDQYEGACSTACQQHPEKRPYDGTGYYTTKLNGYNPYKGIYRAPKRTACSGG